MDKMDACKRLLEMFSVCYSYYSNNKIREEITEATAMAVRAILQEND